MANLVQKRTLNLKYSGGNLALTQVEKFNFDDDSTTEVAVSTVGPIGYQDDDKGGSFSLSVFAVVAADREVDFYDLKTAKELVTFTAQDYPTGHRIQYRGCRIENIKAPTENNGKQMIEVTGKFLGLKVLA